MAECLGHIAEVRGYSHSQAPPQRPYLNRLRSILRHRKSLPVFFLLPRSSMHCSCMKYPSSNSLGPLSSRSHTGNAPNFCPHGEKRGKVSSHLQVFYRTTFLVSSVGDFLVPKIVGCTSAAQQVMAISRIPSRRQDLRWPCVRARLGS